MPLKIPLCLQTLEPAQSSRKKIGITQLLSQGVNKGLRAFNRIVDVYSYGKGVLVVISFEFSSLLITPIAIMTRHPTRAKIAAEYRETDNISGRV